MAPIEQSYDAWFVDYPSTHEKAGQTVEVVPRAWAEAEVERLQGTLRVVLSFGTTLPPDCREIVLEALNG